MPISKHEFNPATPILGTLASCENVVDRHETHNHLLDILPADQAAYLLEFALSQVDSNGKDFIVEDVDCNELNIALQTDCVATTPEDEIVFAYRGDRPYATRFVLNRDPEPTEYITTILKRRPLQPGIMVLISAHPGRKGASEPWNARPGEMSASLAFWRSHALVWDPSAVNFDRPFGRVEEVPELNFENYMSLK
jgi:hypothetical protein